MKVIGYCRVSTDSQAERGVGLAVQEKALRSWCATEGYELVQLFRDEGESGSNGLDARRGLLEAMLTLKELEGPKGLAVYRLDRLARDLILQESLLREVSKIGAQTFSTQAGEAAYLGGDDHDDAQRTMIRHILGAISQYERSLIHQRMSAGRALRREQGHYVGDGPPPYGFEVATDDEGNKWLAPVPEEQAALERVRELRSEGASLRAIGAALDAEGYRPRRASRWSPQAVKLIAARLDA